MSIFKRPCNGPLTSYYGKRVHPVTGVLGKMHHGLDYGNSPSDNRIFAVGDGYVKMARWMNGYGNMIVTRHIVNGKNYDVVYAHLSSFKVRVGQKVKTGQTIAIKGNTGVGTGVHLHLEVHVGQWTGNMRNTRNPALYIYDKGVHEEQARLNHLGISVKADGYYGKATENAVRIFQKRVGLTADGFLGSGTRYQLMRKTKGFDFNKYLKEQNKEQQKQDEKVDDEMSKPFNAGTSTLNNAAKRMIEEAVVDGILTDKTWIEKFDKNQISAHQMLGLSILIQERRNKMFKPKTHTLKNEVQQMIEEAIKDGTLHNDQWLKEYKNNELSGDDIVALKLLIDERRRKKNKK